MNSYQAGRALKVVASLLVIALIWEMSCRFFSIPAYLIPAPSSIVAKLIEKRDLYVYHGWITLYETFAGFAVAVIFGIAAAMLIVLVPSIRDVLMPLLLIAQLVPKVAIAPILLVWFGYGVLPKVIIAFLVAFFPIVVNVGLGLAAVEKELLDLGKSLEASRWQIFWKFRIPSALPELFGGMKIAVTLAIIGAIIGEFVGGDKGLGYLVIIANQELDTPLAFAALFVISAIGIALYALVEFAERMLIPWNRSQESDETERYA
ncbi:ABC transporter permease [Bradyrhizobium sp. dw_411]|uniref:ABC transporter permease n=1 Tax=Bradyrhizobium sp. dw_411 TaxID=2720082 RepID=UPI001BD1427E|nr:ABC transporter permease [Bradyrhizobium sp. dw_411]